MKIRRIIAPILSMVIAASLCGCSSQNEISTSCGSTSLDSSITDPENSTSNSTSGSSSDTSDSAPESSDDTSKTKEPLEFFGALNEPIARSEIVKAGKRVYNEKIQKQEMMDIPLDKLDKFEYFNVYTDFAYYALPIYLCLTNLESEYDEVNNVFKDAPQENKNDLLRAKKGDKLFDMTVTEANSSFYLGAPEGKYKLVETHLSLKGDLTLSGYARIVPGDEYGYNTGDIIFVPVGEVCLPVVNFSSDYENGNITRSVGNIRMVEDIFCTNEFPGDFTLGNINDTTADISCLARDGSFTKVSVTISEIEMNSNFNWFSDYVATIKSIDHID